MAAAWQGTWQDGWLALWEDQRPCLGTAAPNGFELSWWDWCMGNMCICACACVCIKGLEGPVCLVARGHHLQGFALHGNWGFYLHVCMSSNTNESCVA